MIWLTWRQFRAQAVTAAAAIVILAVLYGVTGFQLAHLYNASGLANCHVHADCGPLATKFTDQLPHHYKLLLYAGILIMYLVPTLIGVFWGAPLVSREIEAGTLRLAWNQSVTRRRWLAVKLAVVGLTAMAAAGLLSLIVSWWAAPIDTVSQVQGQNGALIGSSGRLDPLVFGGQGIAPIGYAAFAVALGVVIGVLVRRTVPAMATTLAGFAAVQVAWPLLVRPHLISPATATPQVRNLNNLGLDFNGNGTLTISGLWHQAGAWLLSNQTITPKGRIFTGGMSKACTANSFQACTRWLVSQHLRVLISYQPASRFWAFQWYETAIFIVLAGGLVWLCAWLLNRRRSA
jgi:ABC-2 family transporter protein